MDEWTVVHPDKGVLFSLKKDILSPATTWMNLEDSVLNEMS